MIARIWIVIAGVLLIAAAAFLWLNNVSAAFVTATLGAVAWFLNYRSELRSKIIAEEKRSNDEANEG